MFDIGTGELALIAVVALLVLGPERLPKAARFVGLWVRKARAQWFAMKNELEQELANEELRRSMQETRQALQDLQQGVQLEASALPSSPTSPSTPPATGQGHDGT